MRAAGPGAPVTCAVSGGPDSLALLALATHAGCRVTAVHVDHGLRPGSAAEADVVRAAAERFGAGFRAEVVAVAPGPNLEARARAARYGVLPPDVLTGHTADDQAETVLLNLVRGAGLDGLAGMGPARRPLRRLRRRETVALCAELGLCPVVDPTNTDPAFRRNRVRHELIPLLEAIAARDVVPVLARQADLVRDDAALLDELAAAIDPTDAGALAAAPPPWPAGPCGGGCATAARAARSATSPTPRPPNACWPSPAATPSPASSPAAGGWRGAPAGYASSRRADRFRRACRSIPRRQAEPRPGPVARPVPRAPSPSPPACPTASSTTSTSPRSAGSW